jgi:hypothetical protein
MIHRKKGKYQQLWKISQSWKGESNQSTNPPISGQWKMIFYS